MKMPLVFAVSFILLCFTSPFSQTKLFGQSFKAPIKKKLTHYDKKIMKLINRKTSIDKSTFLNITPDKNSKFYISGLKIYQARPSNWTSMDPPGPPWTFISYQNKIFRDITQALNFGGYVPKNKKEALKIALIILNYKTGTVIEKKISAIKGIPQFLLSKYNTQPKIIEKNKTYEITIFSYVVDERFNHFVRPKHVFIKNTIFIGKNQYKIVEKIIWKKKN